MPDSTRERVCPNFQQCGLIHRQGIDYVKKTFDFGGILWWNHKGECEYSNYTYGNDQYHRFDRPLPFDISEQRLLNLLAFA